MPVNVMTIEIINDLNSTRYVLRPSVLGDHEDARRLVYEEIISWSGPKKKLPASVPTVNDIEYLKSKIYEDVGKETSKLKEYLEKAKDETNRLKVKSADLEEKLSESKEKIEKLEGILFGDESGDDGLMETVFKMRTWIREHNDGATLIDQKDTSTEGESNGQ